MDNIKIVKVTRAVIEKGGKILVARRSRDVSFPLKWEFPGGKMEEGEAPAQSLKREIKEELDTEIEIKFCLPEQIRFYGGRNFEIIPFVCTLTGDSPRCLEHEEILWYEPKDLAQLDWADVDFVIYSEYLKHIGSQ